MVAYSGPVSVQSTQGATVRLNFSGGASTPDFVHCVSPRYPRGTLLRISLRRTTCSYAAHSGLLWLSRQETERVT